MTELEGTRGSEGCSPSTHAWFKEVYDQVRQMAYDLRLDELHEVARRLEDVHEIVHPPLVVRLSVPRGPDERQRMSAFVGQVFASTHDEATSSAQRDDGGEAGDSAEHGRVIDASPSDLLESRVHDNPNDETFGPAPSAGPP